MFKWPRIVAGSFAYPLQERALRRPTFSYLEFLERCQTLPRAGIEQLQLDRLRALLRVAHAHSPWHRARLDAAGLCPDRIEGLADLQRLPCMTKADAAANREQIVWGSVP